MEVQLHLFLSSALMEVSGHLRVAAALPPGKEPQLIIKYTDGLEKKNSWHNQE